MIEKLDDRLLKVWLHASAPPSVPDGLFDRIERATQTTKPRPRWLARIAGQHLGVTAGSRVRDSRLGLALAALALLAAGSIAVILGSRPSIPVVPAVSAGPTETPARPSPSRRPATPPPPAETFPPIGTLPDGLYGAWASPVGPGGTFYFLRAGDPICELSANPTEACVVVSPHVANLGSHTDVLHVDGRTVTLGLDCVYAAFISRDTLTLTGRPGSCEGHDLVLRRAPLPPEFEGGLSGSGGEPLPEAMLGSWISDDPAHATVFFSFFRAGNGCDTTVQTTFDCVRIAVPKGGSLYRVATIRDDYLILGSRNGCEARYIFGLGIDRLGLNHAGGDDCAPL